MLTAQEKTVFMHSLRNGLGFSKSCLMVDRTPKEITSWIKDSDLGNEFFRERITNVTTAYKHLLIVSNTFIQSNNFDKWKQNNELIRNFLYKLNLWECYTTKEGVTPEIFLKAIMLYKYDDEVATAIGFTLEEYADFIITREYHHDSIDRARR